MNLIIHLDRRLNLCVSGHLETLQIYVFFKSLYFSLHVDVECTISVLDRLLSGNK